MVWNDYLCDGWDANEIEIRRNSVVKNDRHRFNKNLNGFFTFKSLNDFFNV